MISLLSYKVDYETSLNFCSDGEKKIIVFRRNVQSTKCMSTKCSVDEVFVDEMLFYKVLSTKCFDENFVDEMLFDKNVIRRKTWDSELFLST